MDMRMRRLITKLSLFIPALMLAVSARTVLAGNGDEVLLLPVPKGWHQVSNIRDGSEVTFEFAPGEMKAGDLGDMIIRKAFYGGAAKMDAEYYYKREAELESKSCPGSKVTPMKSGNEDGNEFAFWWVYCPKHPTLGHGQVTAAKVIRGKRDLFAVYRLRKIPPFDPETFPLSKEEINEWSRYMKSVTVCAAGDGECVSRAEGR
jgi:hypothetical protein